MISVVIPNWNGKKLLPICLNSLKNQTCKDFEIIVVDNGSTDGSVDFIKKNYPDARIISLGENRGFSAAANAGISESRGELIVLFNNDAEADPSLMEVLFDKSRRYPDAAFFACKILLYHYRDVLDSAGVLFYSDGRFIPRGCMEKDEGKFDTEERIFGGHGAAVMYRKNIFNEIGLFDEDFFAYYEDSELNMRINLAGHYGMYIPSARVYHVGSGTGLKINKNNAPGNISFEKPTEYGKKVSDFIAYYIVRNRWMLMAKSFPTDLILKNLSVMALLELSQLIVWVVVKRRPGIYFIGFVDFIRKLPLMLKKRKMVMETRKISGTDLLARSRRVYFIKRLLSLNIRVIIKNLLRI